MYYVPLKKFYIRIVACMFFSIFFISATANAFSDKIDSSNEDTQLSSMKSFSSILSRFSESGDIAVDKNTREKLFLLNRRTDIENNIVISALSMIGIRYRWGGNSPYSGLDCSGFVRYVFKDAFGISLPRRVQEMSYLGEKINISSLKPGDIVFFNTMNRRFSHVGIYIGHEKFVHSPSTGSTIRVDYFNNNYWRKHFTGARRIKV